MSNFTDGPYAVFADERSIIVSADGGKTKIARMMSAKGRDLENAHLFASAPLLLAALIEARDVVVDFRENAATDSATVFAEDMLKQIDEAIAASTGNGVVTTFEEIATK